jgi:hypothetical protein
MEAARSAEAGSRIRLRRDAYPIIAGTSLIA